MNHFKVRHRYFAFKCVLSAPIRVLQTSLPVTSHDLRQKRDLQADITFELVKCIQTFNFAA